MLYVNPKNCSVRRSDDGSISMIDEEEIVIFTIPASMGYCPDSAIFSIFDIINRYYDLGLKDGKADQLAFIHHALGISEEVK